MFRNYNREIRKILSHKDKKHDWGKLLQKHRRMISFIQHERLIHLIVTLFTGLIMALSFFFSVAFLNLFLFFVGIPILILFIAYLFHYRFLENTTQGWYKVEEELEKFHAK